MHRSRTSRYPRHYSQPPPPPRRRGPHPRPPSPSSMKIFPVYVGNIAKDASVSDLRAVFGRFGNVLEVTVISEHGFVTYDSVEEASEAVRSLDGFQMCGKTLEVDYSDEMKAYFARQSRSGRHVKCKIVIFFPRSCSLNSLVSDLDHPRKDEIPRCDPLLRGGGTDCRLVHLLSINGQRPLHLYPIDLRGLTVGARGASLPQMTLGRRQGALVPPVGIPGILDLHRVDRIRARKGDALIRDQSLHLRRGYDMKVELPLQARGRPGNWKRKSVRMTNQIRARLI